MLGVSRNCLSSTGCRQGEDVKDSVLPKSHWQAWKKWESTKQEIETKATKAGVIRFVDEDEVVQHILEIISSDEIAMDVTYEEGVFFFGQSCAHHHDSGSH